MSVNVVELSRVAPQPWKNGGGVTYPMLCWPHESDWCVRVSIANIDRDGPFSAFPDVTRFIAAVSGDGVRLGDPLNVDVTSSSGVHRWPGEIAPYGALINGATRDLNMMIDNRRAHGELCEVNGRAASATRFDAVRRDARSAICGFITEGSAQLFESNLTRELAPLSLVWTQANAPESQAWRIIGSRRLWGFNCEVIDP